MKDTKDCMVVVSVAGLGPKGVMSLFDGVTVGLGDA